MSQDGTGSGAARGVSAASEERFIASTEEFTASASRATLIATNLIQAALVAAVVMRLTHWYLVDPIISVLIALLILGGAWKVVDEAGKVLASGDLIVNYTGK